MSNTMWRILHLAHLHFVSCLKNTSLHFLQMIRYPCFFEFYFWMVFFFLSSCAPTLHFWFHPFCCAQQKAAKSWLLFWQTIPIPNEFLQSWKELQNTWSKSNWGEKKTRLTWLIDCLRYERWSLEFWQLTFSNFKMLTFEKTSRGKVWCIRFNNVFLEHLISFVVTIFFWLVILEAFPTAVPWRTVQKEQNVWPRNRSLILYNKNDGIIRFYSFFPEPIELFTISKIGLWFGDDQ